jgi:excisionase family DNA binding protein
MTNNSSSTEHFSRLEAAAYLRVSVKTIDRLFRNGRINGYKLGRRVLIYQNSLTEEFINSTKPKFTKK